MVESRKEIDTPSPEPQKKGLTWMEKVSEL